MTADVPRVGLSVTSSFLAAGTVDPGAVVRAAADAGLDYLQVGDHVSFHDGTGFDGLIHATAALTMQPTLPVQVGLYLLALRHPVVVARQLADLGRLAPGRLELGVGVGGEDRAEFENCGVDPATRGRRTDEALGVLLRLLDGEKVSVRGEFFDLTEAAITPVARPRPPVLVGGRSDAALRRTGRFGNGWLALWVSPERYRQATAAVAAEADRVGREHPVWQHGLNLWCGVVGTSGDDGQYLPAAMEERYKMPFERFQRWCPIGTAAEIADVVRQYAAAGCSAVTLVIPTDDPLRAVESAAEVRHRLHAA